MPIGLAFFINNQQMQYREENEESTILGLISYIAQQNPNETNNFLVRYGYTQSSTQKQLEEKTTDVIIKNADNEKTLIDFLKLHPDKNLIIENYKNGNLKACSCGCDECDGRHDAFYRQSWFISGVVLLGLLGIIYCIVKNSN